MEKMLILTGRVDNKESYQLLINCNYISGIYDNTEEREKFYDELSNAFVERILQEKLQLELGVFNGLRINPETGRNERIPRLDNLFVNQFAHLVCEKIKQGSVRTLPACIRN